MNAKRGVLLDNGLVLPAAGRRDARAPRRPASAHHGRSTTLRQWSIFSSNMA